MLSKRARLSAIVVALCLWVIAANLLSACNAATKSTPLRIGLNIWPGYGAFFIADANGYFTESHVPVKIEIIQGDAEREQALVANKLDGIGMTMDNLVRLRDKDMKLKAIYKYDDSYGADGIVARKSIRKIPDLRDKTVAYALGTPSHYFLTQILKEHDLSTKDVRSITMSADDAGSAFAAGKLDAAVTWEPWLSKAKAMPDGHVLISTREKPVIQDVLFLQESVLTTRRGDVVNFLGACFKAVEYWKKNPADAKSIIAKALKLPVADVEGMLPGIRIMDYEMNKAFFGTSGQPGPAYQAYRAAVEAWLKEGLIRRPQDPAMGIDDGPINALGKQ